MIECNNLCRKPGQSPVRLFSAPWTLKAETYVLFLKLDTLPDGVYDAVEETWAGNGLGQFVGGVGTIMIVRYSDTPSGKILLPSRKIVFWLLWAAESMSLLIIRIPKAFIVTFRDITREEA
jgi:hypothetical protein